MGRRHTTVSQATLLRCQQRGLRDGDIVSMLRSVGESGREALLVRASGFENRDLRSNALRLMRVAWR
jgi:hypothetical protein